MTDPSGGGDGFGGNAAGLQHAFDRHGRRCFAGRQRVASGRVASDGVDGVDGVDIDKRLVREIVGKGGDVGLPLARFGHHFVCVIDG